ncbi:hypothetical protein MSAN_01540000 [Mycena sanguinolenta]|uniref:F-box domain-containing protein n=1 Tax=Mycena sanguinolenta TaxID=230812 RepID=A0A8H6Y6U3_9AGAR|nr:hypothetical protein MSAN_01540000 [Mycena sanguinolenta]
MESMSATMLLSDLAPELIFSIFACCDISSVVSVGQTCRYLHALAFDKSVWLGLLNNLRRRLILDHCTHNLEALSTDEMIGANLDSYSAPQVTKRITLHPFGTGPGVLEWGHRAKLLPSGRYVLLNNSGTLECWNLGDDRVVWRYTTTIEHAEVYQFAAEEKGIESTIMIVICVRAYPRNARRLYYVEIFSVDIQNGTQNRLLTARAPESEDHFLSEPVISGNFAAVIVDSGQTQHMIINWVAQSYFIVDGHPDTPSRIAFIPQHLVLMNRSLDEKDQIHLISNDALSTYWVPITTRDDAEFSPIFAENIPKRSTFEDPHAEQTFTDMHVHESPLREGDYRLWIHGSNRAAKGGLFSCTLSIPSNGMPQWCQRMVTLCVTPAVEVIPYFLQLSRHRLNLRELKCRCSAGTTSASQHTPGC